MGVPPDPGYDVTEYHSGLTASLGSGAGVSVVHVPCELERLPWDGTPLLAQAYVETGGVDLHLCVAGDRVWATRRPSPRWAYAGEGSPSCDTPAAFHCPV